MFWTRRQNANYAVAPSARKPLARDVHLVVQEVDDEVLVYDEIHARAHCLNAEAARVWRACDGQKSHKQLAEELGMEHDVVVHALSELESKRLLDDGPLLSNGTTRREFGVRTVKLGVAGAAVPTIFSVAVATPMAAATPTPQQCLYYSAKSCDGCTSICGCCCCCQGCSSATEPACKLCYPTSLCGTGPAGPGSPGCKTYVPSECSSGPNCSATAKAPPKCQDPCPPLSDCGGHPCNCFNIGAPCVT